MNSTSTFYAYKETQASYTEQVFGKNYSEASLSYSSFDLTLQKVTSASDACECVDDLTTQAREALSEKSAIDDSLWEAIELTSELQDVDRLINELEKLAGDTVVSIELKVHVQEVVYSFASDKPHTLEEALMRLDDLSKNLPEEVKEESETLVGHLLEMLHQARIEYRERLEKAPAQDEALQLLA